MKTLSGKWLIRSLIFFSFTFCIGFSAAAQCTFGKGDLVFTGYNLLDDGNNGNTVDDSFSFLLLNKIPAGQVIYFTDLGWTSSNAFQTPGNARSDAIIKWTADVAYPAGTEIIINCKYKLTAVAIDGSARGTVTIEQDSYNSNNTNPKEHMSLGEIAGDQIFAFIGTPTTPLFLAGISVHRDPALAGWDATLGTNEFAAEKSMLPAGLASDAQNLVIQKLLDGESAAPAARYNKVTGISSGLPATLRNAINLLANWEIKSDGDPFTAPILTPQVYAVTGASIVTQPVATLSVCPGTGTTITVSASNACTYQWKVSTDGGTLYNNVTNAGVYSNATTATLGISSVTGLNNNKYLVEISGIGAAISSTATTLTLSAPPAITTQPVATSVSAGSNTTFTAQVSDATSYQWQVNQGAGFSNVPASAPYSGTTSSTLTITGATAGLNNYVYRLIALGPCTPNAISNAVVLTVNNASIATTGSLGLMSTTFGASSTAQQFSVSGLNLTEGIVVTPPNGFEVSTNNSTFSPTVTVGAAGTLSSTPIYVRLSSTAAAGPYSGNIQLTSSGATAVNVSTTTNGANTINVAPITITANPASKTYGQVLTTTTGATTFTPSSGSLKNGNTLNTVTLSYTGGAAGTAAVTAYPGAIVPSAVTGSNGFLVSNYLITYVAGDLTINKATLSIAASNATKNYGQSLTGGAGYTTFTPTGLQNSETIASTSVSYGTGSTATAAVNTYTGSVTLSTATGGTFNASNYSITYTPADIVVNTAPLTVTATGPSKYYGVALIPGSSTTNFSSSTLQNGELINSVTLIPDAAGLSATTAAGTAYLVTPSSALGSNGFAIGNYTITYVPYNGTVAVAPQTITFSAFSPAVYGDADIDPGATSSSTLPVTYTTNDASIATIVSGKVHIKAAGTVIIYANQVGSTNYAAASQVQQTLTITTKPITVTASTGQTKVYGSPDPAYAYTITSGGPLQTGDSFTGALGRAAGENIGTAYAINQGDLSAGTNYNITFVPNNFAITVKPITVTATAGQTKVYGSADPAFAYTITSGGPLKTGDSFTGLLGRATGEDIGTTYAINQGDLSAGTNYNITFVPNNFAITAKTLTVALNQTPAITKVYDNTTTATLAAANYTLSGIEFNDAITVSGTTTYDTKDAGTGKTITANTFVLAGAQKANYNLTTVTATTTGAITSLPVTLALNATPLVTKVYDNSTTATLAAANYTITGILGTDAVTVSGTAAYDTKDAGTGKTITANTFVLAGAQKGNYNLTTTTASTTGVITALPVTLTLNATPLVTKVYDNSTTATLAAANYTLTGVLGLDAVTVSGMATYDTKDAGTGKTITANTFVLAGAQKGNYNLTTTTATTTGDITALPITLALNATPVITKVYNNNTGATLAAANYSLIGVLGLDAVTVSGTATYDTKDAGTGKTITANTFVLAGAQKGNYNLTTTTVTTTGDITTLPVTLALNATPVVTKVYDNNTSATLVAANFALTGVLGLDAVTVSGTATYDTKDAGTGKTITVNTFVLAGAQKGNYNLTTTTATTTGDITALPVTLALNATPMVTKVYDNSTTATLVPANYSLTGVLGLDAVTVSGTATYDTKNVGTGKIITANTFVLAGAQKGNYNLTTTTATTTGDITALPVTLALNATPVVTKVYDNSTTATLVPANYTLTGVLGLDAVTVSGTATYDTKDAGTGKTITANNFALAGAQQGNYSLTTTTATTTGNITALPVTLALNATPVITKVYDNSTTATLVPANYSLTGVLGLDAVTVSGTATYDTKNVGTSKTITANTFVLAGAQKGNYNLTTTTATTTGNITALPVTLALNATPVVTKVYDNTTTATLAAANYTLTGVLGLDAVSVSGTATYDTKDAGTGKTITANTFVLAGAQNGNYNLTTTTATTTGNITALPITLALNATPVITKVYDNGTGATLIPSNYTLTGVLGLDAVTVSGTAAYDTKNVGTGKTITANAFVLAGAQKGNYNLTTTTASTTGNITALPLTLALNATPVITKVYDNSTTATLAAANYSLTGVLGSDAVTVSGTAAYDTKNAGTGKTITANTFVLAGAQQGNYSLTTTTASTTGNITSLPVTLALNATPLITKVYDNTTAATLAPANYSLTGILGTDAVTVSGTAAYDTKDAGTGKTITANTFILAGAQQGNYNLTTTTATTTGNITNKTLTVALNATPAITKVYDNSTAATLAPANYTLTGVETGDVVAVSGTAVYDTKDAGTGKTITANTFVLSGAQKDNYMVSTTTATTTGDVTVKALSLSLNAVPLITKAYDNTTGALLAAGNYSLTGVLGTDAVSVSGTAAYDTKDAGIGKTITANAFVLAGAQKGNYNLTTTTASTTGNITALPLTLALNATPLITKVYDNSTTATLVPANYTLSGVLGTDAVTVSGTAAYDTKNTGTGKTITANTFVLAGAQQGNYNLTTTTATTTGNVTPKAIAAALNALPLITKVYDNTTTATLAPANYSLTGVLGTDAVTVSGTAAYDTKNAGTGKTITANTFVLAGAQQGNYNLTTTTATTTGNITASTLTLALNSSPLVSKVYDGNTVATLLPANYTLTGVQGADVVTVTGTANYNSKDVAVGKTITANGFVLAGAQKDNYSLTTTTATLTGNISTKILTVTADDQTKYQGTANPPLTISYSGFVSGEGIAALTTLPTASTTATVASAVGNYDITASGGAAVNYSFNFVKGTLKVLPGAPTSITFVAVPLYENRPAGTVAGTLSSTSDNPSSTFTYSLVAGTGGGDNASFSIVGDQLRSTASFDFETKSTYSVLVRSTTQYGLSLDKVITINVSDVNEVPTLAAIGNQTICYTRSTQNVALTGISAGPETNQTTTLSVSSTNASLFDRLTVSGSGSTATLVYQAKTGASGTATVTVTVKDSGGTANGGVDTFSQTFVITVNALPVLSINSDKGTQISKGEIVFLNATGAATYAWATDNSIVNGAGTATLQVRPRQTTTYTVTGTNASGCTETQSITITVLDDLAKINATNILTPNGDGYNDKWIIDNIDFYPNNEVKIFDKSGRLVYAKKGYDNSWEGTYNGTALSEGTYYYVIDFGTGRRVFKGFITIVKSN